MIQDFHVNPESSCSSCLKLTQRLHDELSIFEIW